MQQSRSPGRALMTRTKIHCVPPSLSQPGVTLPDMLSARFDLDETTRTMAVSIPNLPTAILCSVGFAWNVVIDESLLFCSFSVRDSQTRPPFIFLFDRTETTTKADARSTALQLLDGPIDVTLTNSRGRSETWAVTPQLGPGPDSPPWRSELLQSLNQGSGTAG